MQNCIKPVVDPNDDVFGVNFFTRSILTLVRIIINDVLTKTTDTHEYARNATLVIHNITAIQAHRARIVNGSSWVVPGTIPRLAMMFKTGKERNVNGQIFMQK
jgi:hypothetical protein